VLCPNSMSFRHFTHLLNPSILICNWSWPNTNLSLKHPKAYHPPEVSEDFPGPIKLPTRSVFDLNLALSFNCLTMVCFYFRKTNYSINYSLICYSYMGYLGALACSFSHQRLAHAYQNICNTPRDLYC
jgi:hypothetical protein